MDQRVSSEDVASVLQDFDRRKRSEEYKSAGSDARNVASAIGTDTPLTVLIDIRDILSEVQKSLRDHSSRLDAIQELITDVHIERKETEFQHHTELLAFLHKSSESSMKNSLMRSHSPMPRTSIGSTADAEKYYYKGEELKTNQSIVGCILLHLECMISKVLPSSGDISDVSVMELKDWSSAATILREADSNSTPNTGTLSFPKKGSEESALALDVVASPLQGRTTVCKNEHVQTLISSCPAIIRCVEEVRLRALRCPGIISSLRLKNLSAVAFPYVTREGDLNITNRNPKGIGSAVVCDKVKQMNVPQKKMYANLILRDGKKPIIAATAALEKK